MERESTRIPARYNTGVLCTALFLCCVFAATGLDYLPGREAALPHSEVIDSFFGYFIGIVDKDAVGMMDSDYLHLVLPEFTHFFSMPIEELKMITRVKTDGEIIISLCFNSDVYLSIPLKVLWDEPGFLSAGGALRLRETRFPTLSIPAGGDRRIELSPVYAYHLYDGYFFIDFDDWLDVLLGSSVDDVYIKVVVLFKYNDVWYGALMGRGYQGQIVLGYFNFQNNRILIPRPRKFRNIGAYFMSLLD